MILEIDAGNSRIKWRIVAENPSEPEIVASGNVLTAVTSTSGATDLEEMISDLSRYMKNISRVKVSSVRGESFQTDLVDRLNEKWQLQPEFAKVEKNCGGVTNSYIDVSMMGIDRWLALLAAYKKTANACCVLDYGSAITFDSVDAEGVHQGGYIVPGFHLMQESLARKTPALNIALQDWISLDPGLNTQEAISNGIATMVSGFAERCYKQFLKNNIKGARQESVESVESVESIDTNTQQADFNKDEVRCFLTGGDAIIASRNLALPHQVEVDLVLEGLAIALP
jgi:type III pantothenate kinase